MKKNGRILNIRMGGESMPAEKVLQPEIMVFAGPNGSGKSTITKMAKTVGKYVNADDIKRANLCSDMDAALKAEELREKLLDEGGDFTFETVLSTDRNLNLLARAKDKGYFIRGIYVLTANSDVNVMRVKLRESLGGHGVPEEKIRSRYDKAMTLIPRLVDLCDILHIYDNTDVPFRIFKKRKTVYYHWENQFWSFPDISKLTGVSEFDN